MLFTVGVLMGSNRTDYFFLYGTHHFLFMFYPYLITGFIYRQ